MENEMEDKRANDTVSGNSNSIYAAQAGEGPGPREDETPKKNQRFNGTSPGRQEAGPTIESHDLSPSEGMGLPKDLAKDLPMDKEISEDKR